MRLFDLDFIFALALFAIDAIGTPVNDGLVKREGGRDHDCGISIFILVISHIGTYRGVIYSMWKFRLLLLHLHLRGERAGY